MTSITSYGSYDDRSPLLGSSPARGATATRPAAIKPRPSRASTDSDPGKVLRKRTVSITSIPEEDDLNLVGFAGSCFCHPRAFCHRLIALFLMCFLGFGSTFCFDNPGALQREIKDAMGISTYSFANLYSWYNWPNVILPIIGGYLMDSVFGIRLGTIIFALIIIIGQVVFSLGGFLFNFPLMQVGRFIFGIGGESLAVAQNTYAVSWFKGKELNMVFGFQLSVARVGSTINFLALGPLYAWLQNYFNPHVAIGWTLLVAGGSFCVLSFICALVLGALDKRAERLLKKESERDAGETVQLRDIATFPATFWLLSLVCLSYYVAIFPFISLGQVFFMKKFDFEAQNANFITGLIYLISAPASPLLGFLIDKTGLNITYVFIAISTTLLCHVLLAFSFINPYVAISIMGVAYSLLASALWPIAALIIPEYQLGTAYGFMQSIQNAGLAVITLLAGMIVDQFGYIWLEIFFISWLAVALTCTVVIWIIDIYTTGYLNMTVKQREAYDEEKRLREEEEERAARRMAAQVNLIRPRTAAELRNRYLYRIGAVLPPHMGHARLVVGSRPAETAPPTRRNVPREVET